MAEIQAVIDRSRAGGATYTEVKTKGEKPRNLALRPDPMFADMLTVATFTGLCIGELCGLLVEEVNLELGVVQVRKQLDKRPPHGRVALKSKNSRRDVPISVELRPVLERFTAGRMPGEYLFTNRDGRPFLPSGAGDKVLRVATVVGGTQGTFPRAASPLREFPAFGWRAGARRGAGAGAYPGAAIEDLHACAAR